MFFGKSIWASDINYKMSDTFLVFSYVTQNNTIRHFLVWKYKVLEFGRIPWMGIGLYLQTKYCTLFHRAGENSSFLRPLVWSLWPEEREVWDFYWGHCDQRSKKSETSSVVTVTRGAKSMRPLVWSLWPEERKVWDLWCGHCDQRSEKSETSGVVTVTRGARNLRLLVWSLWPEEREVWDF
jgi:hypothetical protein